MKNSVRKLYSFFAILIAAGLLSLGACSGNEEDILSSFTDDPEAGSMTASTAGKIFTLKQNAQGDVTITKFKSAAALAAYLDGSTTFIIREIAGKPVTGIASEAFDGSAPLPDDLQSIQLPDTITELAADSFVSLSIDLLIPEEVIDFLEATDPYVLYMLAQAVGSIKPSAEGEPIDPPAAYVVTISSGITHGKITAGPKSGAAGKEITLTISPDTGRRLIQDSLRVFYGEPETDVPLSPQGNTAYTFTLPAFNVTVSAAFEEIPGGGGGSTIKINSAADLQKIGETGYPLNGTYQLQSDITLTNWRPMGADPDAPFTGIFDGSGKTIVINSFYTASNPTAIGLFGYTEGALIKDIKIQLGLSTLLNLTVGPCYVGGAAGYASNTEIQNVSVKGAALSTVFNGTNAGFNSGAIAGLLSGASGLISGCSAEIDVSAESSGIHCDTSVGGIAGQNRDDAKIINSHFSGNVSATANNNDSLAAAGGIVGRSQTGPSIQNCSAAGGAIQAFSHGSGTSSEYPSSAFAGGIAGRCSGNSTIDMCYATSKVSAVSYTEDAYAGGIAGSHDQASVTQKSYASGDVDATAARNVYSGGIAGLHGHGSSELPGSANQSRIEDTYATGNVSAETSGNDSGKAWAGGVAGRIVSSASTAMIQRSYAAGSVSALSTGGTLTMAGGIAGGRYNAASIRFSAALSQTISAVSSGGTAEANRVVGSGSGDINYNIAYESMNVNGNSSVGAGDLSDLNGRAESAGNLKRPSAVYSSAAPAGLFWDFTNTWVWRQDYSYPALKWQTTAPAAPTLP
ncbi:MAG: hypothetical protein LBQ57_04885 [Spirochaetales bacterium]|nr:hypothetical protein [Spirochaetales bacterium]